VSLDWHGIAERIRGLIRIDTSNEVSVVAARLGVDEQSLRLSMAGRAPLPTPAVISALVRVYGLDPSWVITGDYDPATHRVALESDRVELDAFVRKLIAERANGPIRDAARHPPTNAEA
jgi:hypothetical protein